MPYVKERMYLDPTPRPVMAGNPGDLNFQFTRLIVDYIHGHGLSYQTINDILGALEGAKDEFQRRIAHPYENRKLRENGDVGYDVIIAKNLLEAE